MKNLKEITKDEMKEINGGTYDPMKVIQVWSFCYGVGYALGKAVKNWRN